MTSSVSAPASIVILTYNTRDIVLQCLAQFSADLARLDWQILVVDNASSDDTLVHVRRQFPAVETVRSEVNLGFAGGNNLGLRRATGEAVILLNSDVLASPDALRTLVSRVLAEPDIGAASAGLLTREGQPQAFAYGMDPTLSYLLQRNLRAALRLGPLHRWDVSDPVACDWVSGACLCARRAAIKQAGLLDEDYFLYFEDNDWCLRMRQAGWRIMYDPRVKVVHLGGTSQPERSAARDTYYRSLLTFYRKHYSRAETAMLRAALGFRRSMAAWRR